MVRLVLIIANVAFIQCLNIFNGKMVCVFNPQRALKMSNLFNCAIQCQMAHCQIFHFNQQTSICFFYDFKDICDSRNRCNYVTAYFNDEYAKNVRSFY